ncbi:hypothetical protein LP420_34685 [Massilia sp. B-10]|nr:hypothetical protein LP420_34685 [Massilia sp. B-10]
MSTASTLRQLARRLFRVVLLLRTFACALLAAMWSAVLVEVAAERQASHTEAVAHSESLARVLAGHVSHVLRQADHATQLYRLRHQSDGQAFTLAEFQRRGGLLDSVLPVRLELPMARFDRDGQQVDAVNQFGPSDVGNQPFFQTLAASSADSAVFSTIVTDSRASRWQIQVARRLSDKNNRFDGAVVMRIDPELFVDDYDRLNLDDNGAMLLMSPGDGLSVRRAGDRLFTSDRVKFAPRRTRRLLVRNAGRRPCLDGVARIYSASDMPRYGLSTLIGIDTRAAMARYQRHRTQYMGMAAIATILISGVIAILMKQSAQLRSSVHEARRAQATLRAAADGSLDGVLILSAWPRDKEKVSDFIIDNLNDKAADMLGRPPPSCWARRHSN